MEKRNLDGIYFKVKRNDEWDNICFSDLTEDEMEEILNGREDFWLKSLCIHLGHAIREIGDQFDIMYEYKRRKKK